MSFKTEITKLHYNKKTLLCIFMPILSLCAFFYSIITKIRNYCYDNDILKSQKVSVKVISVGNLTTGGVGKTPVVAEIARHYIKWKQKVAIILRGYGGKLSNKDVHVVSLNGEILYTAEEIGDEPYWYAENIPEAYVITCRDRVKAANYAITKFAPDVIILDDAFQHRKIKRDIDIVLVDSVKLFGNGKHLPAGPLREDLNGLKRADKLLVMNKSLKEVNTEDILSKLFDKNKISICNVVPSFTYNIKTTEILPLKSDVVAVCAIGQPEQFYNFVQQKYNLLGVRTFDDHHIYKKEDLSDIKCNIITTEKDAVKLEKFGFENIYALKLKLDLNIEEVLKNV